MHNGPGHCSAPAGTSAAFCYVESNVDSGRSSSRTTAAGTDRQEVEELSADARRGGRDPRRSFFLMHRMASYRWLSVLICMGRQLVPVCCAAFCPACQCSPLTASCCHSCVYGCRARLRNVWQSATGPERVAAWQAAASPAPIILTDKLGPCMTHLQAGSGVLVTTGAIVTSN